MPDVLSPAAPLSTFLARAKELYTLPAAALKVLELTASPQVDVRALKNCIETDPTLTAKLLRVVNSSLFGLSRQVSDLNQALALLGVKPLKLLVLGFSLPKALFEGQEAVTLAAYWRRTLTKAAAARDLSEAAFGVSSDEAFIAGLLQDLGQLALVQDLGAPYLAFLEAVKQERGDLAARELATLGFDHAMYSARLLDQWGLPKPLVAAIAERHDMEHLASLPEERRRLPQSLHLAELAARVLADGRLDAWDDLQRAGNRYAALSPEELDRVLRDLQAKVTLLAEALDLELSAAVDSERLLAEAKLRRSEIAGNAAKDLAVAAQESLLWQQVETLRTATAEFLAHPGVVRRPPEATEARPPQWLATQIRDHNLALGGRIELALNRCRQLRAAVSVLVVSIDQEEQLAFAAGPDGLQRAIKLVTAVATALCESEAASLESSESTVAIVLECCERTQAVAFGRRLVETVAQCAAAKRDWFDRSFTVSGGAATLALPPRNFPPRELIEAARRCLSAARASGGNVVKSIDIC
jgi:HD-like signal output (HDOD) protein/GGDEF domain-containing protein